MLKYFLLEKYCKATNYLFCTPIFYSFRVFRNPLYKNSPILGVPHGSISAGLRFNTRSALLHARTGYAVHSDAWLLAIVIRHMAVALARRCVTSSTGPVIYSFKFGLWTTFQAAILPQIRVWGYTGSSKCTSRAYMLVRFCRSSASSNDLYTL